MKVMRKRMLAPSLLSADFGHLADDLELMNGSHCDWFHLDVMDGVFVPNISFGFPVMEAIKKSARKPLDVHLMIVQPEKFIPQIKALGALVMNVHQEACTHLHRVLNQIREAGMKSGVTLNPATPLCMIEDVLEDADLVLLMSVNPGFGGQSFIPHTLVKIRQVRKMLDAYEQASGRKIALEVDGGVKVENIAEIAAAGADTFVAGSAIFSQNDYAGVMGEMRRRLAEARV